MQDSDGYTIGGAALVPFEVELALEGLVVMRSVIVDDHVERVLADAAHHRWVIVVVHRYFRVIVSASESRSMGSIEGAAASPVPQRF